MATTPSAEYSVTLRVEIDHRPGMLGKVASAIGDAGGTIGAGDLVQVDGSHAIRDITVATASADDWPRLKGAVEAGGGAHCSMPPSGRSGSTAAARSSSRTRVR
jgi:malate dehydrogenase (oxaloacetate-decarboxylating)